MPKLGLLWRQEWDPPRPDPSGRDGFRLRGVFDAFADLGIRAEPVIYGDDKVDEVRAQLLDLDGVLVWVNPIQDGRDRSQLDALLREVADAGTWVSAHPDVIMRMATKRVLYDTRGMSWGTDTRLYVSARELQAGLLTRLSDSGALVLKQDRGMGGQGVWKVELVEAADDPTVLVREASHGAAPARVRLSDFAARCASYFAGGGVMIEQPFQERVADGMIRVYLTHDEVVGFAYQYPAGLRPESAGEPPPGKRFDEPGAERFRHLRERVETEWVPEMQQLLDLERASLPVIWDIDFLHGSNEGSYVLCEINASSTFAFPEHAMPGVARAALERVS